MSKPVLYSAVLSCVVVIHVCARFFLFFCINACFFMLVEFCIKIGSRDSSRELLELLELFELLELLELSELLSEFVR